jgi:murein DD-endopeptidase MepM/ murein hydrolase activator NlpD
LRVDLLLPGRAAVRTSLGRVGSSGSVRRTWTAAVPAGKYTARVAVTGAGATRYLRVPLSVVAPTPPPPPAPASLSTATSGVFPVQGPYTFGNEGSRFGAGRPGHAHQGQDVAAAEGTPVVTPRGGTVHWIAYQANGAGHYIVIAGDDGRHYVFMHLQAGSIVVAKGAPVIAGQRIGAVGNTGASEGPHLHFEIWLNGWWATNASTPIDPLPDLLAWA